MDEDIKVLEKELANIRNLIEYYTFESLDYDKKFRMERFEKAIENLINRNKKLEIENKALKAHKNSCPALPTTGVECEFKKSLEKINQTQANKIKDYEDWIKVGMIPKSKVREKIEELKEFQDRYEKCNNLKDVAIKQEEINLLNKLLQEGDDK